jgi:hypothetical protein
MKSWIALTTAALLAGVWPVTGTSAAGDGTNETIVFVRHGEKPPGGLGQLSCQGLNRALALPPVIRKMFGAPAAIYAPNPSEQKADDGKLYDYVRPLATIEPTAIAFGLPIHSAIGQDRIDDLRKQLDAPAYHDAFVLVAWEHWEIARLARALATRHGGDPDLVPDWKGNDFDSIYVVKIHRSGANATTTIEVDKEGLDGQPAACPGEAG